MPRIDPTKLKLLIELAPDLEPPITNKGLNRLANSKTNNGFPEPKYEMGRSKFYDEEEVRTWYTLYKRATVNLGRKPNGKR